MKQLLSLLLVCLLITTTGCASIISGRDQDLTVRSNPSRASVYVDGMPIGETPVTAPVSRKRSHQVRVSKQGYLDALRQTRKGYNFWNLGNLVIGGLIGVVIDFCTGSVYSVSPDEMDVVLEAEPVVEAPVL